MKHIVQSFSGQSKTQLAKAFLASSSHGILDTQAITGELVVVFSNESKQKCHRVTKHEMQESLTYHVETPATPHKEMSKHKGCASQQHNQQEE